MAEIRTIGLLWFSAHPIHLHPPGSPRIGGSSLHPYSQECPKSSREPNWQRGNWRESVTNTSDAKGRGSDRTPQATHGHVLIPSHMLFRLTRFTITATITSFSDGLLSAISSVSATSVASIRRFLPSGR